MQTVSSPETPDTSTYAEAKEITGHSRLVFLSGQIPEELDGSVPKDFEAQARLVFRHIEATLKAADMSLNNLIKITVYLSDRRYRRTLAKVRNEILANHRVALTIIITGIYDPVWLLEVEAVAAA